MEIFFLGHGPWVRAQQTCHFCWQYFHGDRVAGAGFIAILAIYHLVTWQCCCDRIFEKRRVAEMESLCVINPRFSQIRFIALPMSATWALPVMLVGLH